MSGAVKCALVMKDIGLSLKKVTFRFLLQTSRQMGVASSEGNDKEGVVSSEGSDEEGVVSSDESDEEGVASSKGNEKVGVASSKGRHVIEDVNRLLAHVEVRVMFVHRYTYTVGCITHNFLSGYAPLVKPG